MIDDATFERLLKTNEELMEICQSLNEQREFDTASRLIPIADDLTHLVAEITMQKKG